MQPRNKQVSESTEDVLVPKKIGFLLIDGYPLVSLGCAIDALRTANELSSKTLYEWSSFSVGGQEVRSSDGLRTLPDAILSIDIALDVAIVVSGSDIFQAIEKLHLDWLCAQDKRGAVIGGVGTGSLALAKAGLLKNQSCSIHWDCFASMHEEFPEVNFSSAVFCIDRNRMTASGGLASLDMMITMIAEDHGFELAELITDMLICDRVRTRHEQQRVPMNRLTDEGPSKLREVIDLMEANIEDPIDIGEISTLVGISLRQVQRQFQAHMNCTPSAFYMKTRLKRAKLLLMQSSLSMAEVGVATGFQTSSYFSYCYRMEMGCTPKEDWQRFRQQSLSRTHLGKIGSSLLSSAGSTALMN